MQIQPCASLGSFGPFHGSFTCNLRRYRETILKSNTTQVVFEPAWGRSPDCHLSPVIIPLYHAPLVPHGRRNNEVYSLHLTRQECLCLPTLLSGFRRDKAGQTRGVRTIRSIRCCGSTPLYTRARASSLALSPLRGGFTAHVSRWNTDALSCLYLFSFLRPLLCSGYSEGNKSGHFAFPLIAFLQNNCRVWNLDQLWWSEVQVHILYTIYLHWITGLILEPALCMRVDILCTYNRLKKRLTLLCNRETVRSKNNKTYIEFSWSELQ